MKKTKTTILINEEREIRMRKIPTLGKVLFQSFFWVLLIIMEAYIWIFKNSEMVAWTKELKTVWIGMILGAFIIIGLYTYCWLKKYVIRLKKIKLPNIYNVFAMLVTIFRICEIIILFTHFQVFLSFWADGYLPFILFAWICGTTIMAFTFYSFRRAKKIRHQQRRQARSSVSK